MSDQVPREWDEEERMRQFAMLLPPEYFNTIAPAELAPTGWERSPLRLTFHPTVEQVYEEAVRTHRNIAKLQKDREPASPEPTLAEIQAEFRETPIDPPSEIRHLLGRCLWDVFSDNHEVLAPDGNTLDIGSFRGAAHFIADHLNSILGESQYDYMDFYLGSMWLASRADLTPVYVSIFRRLKGRGFDWVYHFPRLFLHDLRPLREAMSKSTEPEWLNYSPEEAFAKEKADQERDAEIARMRESLDETHRAGVEEARNRPPPPTVQAYQTVFGGYPQGWPPTD